jgi:DNA-binding transcriptional ArsR family regulator
MSTPEKRVHEIAPQDLRVIAHPLRIRILDSLRNAGPATASVLAARLRESSGATSYHLRQLAAKGFVEEDTERGKGRERWWRSVYDGYRVHAIEDFLAHPDAEVRGATQTYLQEIASRHTLELATWLGTLHEWPEEWLRAGDLSDFRLRLTPGHAVQLIKKIHEVIESFPEDEGVEGASPFRIHLQSFPLDQGAPE